MTIDDLIECLQMCRGYYGNLPVRIEDDVEVEASVSFVDTITDTSGPLYVLIRTGDWEEDLDL